MIERVITTSLEAGSAGLAAANLDVLARRVLTTSTRFGGPTAGGVAIRSGARLAALALARYGLQSRPAALAAVSGALGYAVFADAWDLLEAPR